MYVENNACRERIGIDVGNINVIREDTGPNGAWSAACPIGTKELMQIESHGMDLATNLRATYSTLSKGTTIAEMKSSLLAAHLSVTTRSAMTLRKNAAFRNYEGHVTNAITVIMLMMDMMDSEGPIDPMRMVHARVMKDKGGERHLWPTRDRVVPREGCARVGTRLGLLTTVVLLSLVMRVALISMSINAERARELGRGSTPAAAHAALLLDEAVQWAWRATPPRSLDGVASAAATRRSWTSTASRRTGWTPWGLCRGGPAWARARMARHGSGRQRGCTSRAKGSSGTASTSPTAAGMMNMLLGTIVGGGLGSAVPTLHQLPATLLEFEGGARRLGAKGIGKFAA